MLVSIDAMRRDRRPGAGYSAFDIAMPVDPARPDIYSGRFASL